MAGEFYFHRATAVLVKWHRGPHGHCVGYFRTHVIFFFFKIKKIPWCLSFLDFCEVADE